MNDCEAYHDTNDMAWCWHVAEVGRDRNSCKKHLTRGILGRGTTSNGTHEIEITFVMLVSGIWEQEISKNLPATQQRKGTCSSGARNFKVKYMAPELG